jgi:hypothetical protein
MKHIYKPGQYVMIGRRKARLVHRIWDVNGEVSDRWVIDRIIDGFNAWNEQDMEPVKMELER